MLLRSLELKNHWTKNIIIAFATLILAAIMFFYIKMQYQAVLGDEKEMVNKAANNIELYLNGHLLALRVLAIHPATRQLDYYSVGEELNEVKSFLHFSHIGLYDRLGRPLSGDGISVFDPQVNKDENFLRVLNGEPVIFISNQQADRESSVALVVPVLDDAGSVSAILTANIPIDEISILVARSNLADGQYIFVTDDAARMLYHPRLDQVRLKETLIQSWSHQVFFDGGGAFLQRSALDGVDKLYVFTSLNRMSWRVVDVIPIRTLSLILFKRSFGDLTILVLVLLCMAMLYRLLRQGRKLQEEMRNARLERLNTVSQLAAGIAHEIRNPLTSIRGFIQLLIKKNKQPPPMTYLDILLAETTRIERLVSEFQMLAKPQKKPAFHTVDISRSIADTMLLMKSQALEKNIRLEYRQQDGLFLCRGNEEQLKQVWINLVRNALEASEPEECVRISVCSTSGQHIIAVSDNGCGISKQVLSKIGTPFLTTKEDGTGLGVSICFSIIEQHGGKILVQSSDQAGTVFTVSLPAAE